MQLKLYYIWTNHSQMELLQWNDVHSSGLLGYRTLSQYDSFTWKMVLKGHLWLIVVKPQLTTFVFQVWETEVWAVLWEVYLWSDTTVLVARWSWNVICQWKWGSLSSPYLIFRSWGDQALNHSPARQSFKPFCWETELQPVLMGDRALSQYNTYSGELVLKR